VFVEFGNVQDCKVMSGTKIWNYNLRQTLVQRINQAKGEPKTHLVDTGFSGKRFAIHGV
jgi:hypothetical protein